MATATAYTTANDMPEPKRRGLKPGQPNPGGFKKGDDPRRLQGQLIVDGQTFAAKARQLGPAVLDWWDTVWRDETAALPVRLRASELIVERGFGKAVSTVDINVTQRSLVTLSMEELEAIAVGEQPRFPITHDCEVVEAAFTTIATTAQET